MKHLIPYLQDGRKAADYLRQLRWPDGVKCPRCGSDAVEPRERCDNGLQRFNCVPCAVRWGQQCAMFTDWTSAIFEQSKLRPLEWLLVLGLWQLKLNATEIAAAADIQERTAQRCINLLDGGIFETYHLDPARQLEHHVETDECYRCSGLLLESYAACLSAKPLSSQYSPKRHNTVSECVAKYASALSTETVNMANSLKYWLWVARFFVFFHRYSIGL